MVRRPILLLLLSVQILSVVTFVVRKYNAISRHQLISDKHYHNRLFADNANSIGSLDDINEQRSNLKKNDGGRVVLLENPQLLIRFRVPKNKTSFKAELEELQELFSSRSRDNNDDKFLSRLSSSGRSAPASDKSFIPSFPEFSSNMMGDGNINIRKGSGKAKPGGRDGERKGSEGARPKAQNKYRGKAGIDYDQDYDYADYSESGFYGDETNASLTSISAGELASMSDQGLSFEEIQMAIYGEYGIKVSVAQIRRRLNENRFGKYKKRTGKTRRDKRKARDARRNPAEENLIELPTMGAIQINDLAQKMEVGVGELIKHLMMNEGVMATMTQSIDISLARRVVEAFGKKVLDDSEDDELELDDDSLDIDEELESVERSPIVTIMGHVDHGKTTLLDKIRNSRVALGEAGGITQSISAFKVETSANQFVTFFDTPGHAAFSEMRIRGANVTDIVVLVVAADDGVMEQTKECIAAAQAARCPVVVAINKIDKEGANVEKVKTELMSHGLLLEEFGGDVQSVQISAKKGTGMDDLLEKLTLQAEIMNLRSAVDADASGTVIEAHIDKGLGVVATALVQRGELRVGDLILAGPSWGKVRSLLSDGGKPLDVAGPSTPVQITGLNGIPNAGDVFSIATSENAAKDVAEARQRLEKQAFSSASNAAVLAQASGLATGIGDSRELLKIPILIKADTQGSVEAVLGAINKLKLEDDDAICMADIVYSGVGDVTSSDVSIAAAAKAKVVAFGVAAGFNAMEEARASNVDVGYYNIVYELLDELTVEIQKTLAPPPPGVFLGRAEVKKVFRLGKAGRVAGSEVVEGLVRVDSKIRILRGKRNEIYSGTISGLKVVKDAVREVPEGSECGISFKDFSDIEEGDIIECFSVGNESKD